MRRCMVPGCRKRASFEMDVEPTPRTTPGSLQEIAPWLKFGKWAVCASHGAEVADVMAASSTAELVEYDIESDPRMYVR